MIDGWLSRARNKVQRDGILRFVIFGWFYTMNRIEQVIPDEFRRIVVQLQWLPFLTFIVKERDRMWKAWKPFRRDFYFPVLHQHVRAKEESYLYKRRQYSCDDFVEVDPDDVVFDIGTFLGQYSLGVADRCEKVIALEPNPQSAACASLNTPSNVTVLQQAAWNSNGQMELQLGFDGSEDSLIEPDDGGSGGEVEVDTVTIDQLASDHGVKTVDLLKVEAEGVEPEILSGMKEVSAKKVAVNAGAERYGDDVVDDVVNHFRERGYEIRTEQNFVYARLS